MDHLEQLTPIFNVEHAPHVSQDLPPTHVPLAQLENPTVLHAPPQSSLLRLFVAFLVYTPLLWFTFWPIISVLVTLRCAQLVACGLLVFFLSCTR
ncbi:hypothetical protein BDW22DRAFT_1357753 [Trametopsis cervina]|nr:hypothetical protein BDW22DRAFT_1357753 [Trametopsis cervina]